MAVLLFLFARVRRRSLSRCILAARTYGLRCLDGVHLDMTDAEGFERACRQGRDMGMDGKTLIHPSTVSERHLSPPRTFTEVLRACFTPTVCCFRRASMLFNDGHRVWK